MSACDRDRAIKLHPTGDPGTLRLVLQADAVQQFQAALACAILLQPCTLRAASVTLSSTDMRGQVAVLEHHADARADLVRVRARVRDVPASQEDLAVVYPLQQVGAAQQRRLYLSPDALRRTTPWCCDIQVGRGRAGRRCRRSA